MKRVFKIGIIVVVALALVGAGALILRRAGPPAAAEETVATATVTRGSIEETVSATGNVAAARRATLAFATSGEIVAVLVEEGQQVAAGETLARLDTTSLEWQIASARAGLATAQAQLAQAQEPASDADLASARAGVDSALANYQKVQEGPTAEDLASARAGVDSALANYQKVKAGPTAEDLASAQASLDSAKASLEQAQAAYDRIKDRPDVTMRQESLTLQTATIEYQRALANYKAVANRPTESDLASAEAQVAQAEAQLAALQEQPNESELTSAASQVAQAEAQLAALEDQPRPETIAVYEAQVEQAAVSLAQAEAQLDDAVLAAPFAGTILAVEASEGEWASPGAPAIVLAATEPLILELNVDEVDVANLAEGQTAYLRFDAIKGEQVAGTVARIAPASTDVSGAVAYGLEIHFDAGGLPVRLGMTANVDIVSASAEDALLVPNRAIEADRAAGRYYVSRQAAGGAVERVEVRIGLRNESQTQIVAGLAEGDRVVLPQVPEQDQGFSGPSGPFGGMRQGNP